MTEALAVTFTPLRADCTGGNICGARERHEGVVRERRSAAAATAAAMVTAAATTTTTTTRETPVLSRGRVLRGVGVGGGGGGFSGHGLNLVA